MGKLDYLKEALERANVIGVTLKVQLFPNIPFFTDSGNVHLPLKTFEKAYEFSKSIGTPFTASVFGEDELKFLMDFNLPFIKFAYSQRKQFSWMEQACNKGHDIMVSTNLMELPKLHELFPDNLLGLFCIPEYPVTYEVNFERMFEYFDGFSDHTLGISHINKARIAGAKIIEKHVTLNHDDIRCPDHLFAVTFNDLSRAL